MPRQIKEESGTDEAEKCEAFFKVALLCKDTILVAMRLGETPVLIPNTMVKTQAADGTILETVWESRWLPDYKWAYSSAG